MQGWGKHVGLYNLDGVVFNYLIHPSFITNCRLELFHL